MWGHSRVPAITATSEVIEGAQHPARAPLRQLEDGATTRTTTVPLVGAAVLGSTVQIASAIERTGVGILSVDSAGEVVQHSQSLRVGRQANGVESKS